MLIRLRSLCVIPYLLTTLQILRRETFTTPACAYETSWITTQQQTAHGSSIRLLALGQWIQSRLHSGSNYLLWGA